MRGKSKRSICFVVFTTVVLWTSGRYLFNNEAGYLDDEITAHSKSSTSRVNNEAGYLDDEITAHSKSSTSRVNNEAGYLDDEITAHSKSSTSREFHTAAWEELMQVYTDKIRDLQQKGLWKDNPLPVPCSDEGAQSVPCMDLNCTSPNPSTAMDDLRDVLDVGRGINERLFSKIIGHLSPTHFRSRVTFVTGASSNHLSESLDLIKNLQEIVFPQLVNFTFAYYDLGLKKHERLKVQEQCDCELRTFPLHLMPKYLQDLRCYSWKPLIIQANLPSTDILIWVDSSIRFTNQSAIKPMLMDIQQKGMLTYRNILSTAQLTSKKTFNHFKAEPCEYADVPETTGGFLCFHNEKFIQEIIVKSWAMCAMHPNCMCSVPSRKGLYCNLKIRKYNKCHRYDQSAMTLILAKLFRHHQDTFLSKFNALPNVFVKRK
ncbi:uncharacterized protein LOC124128293 [Haliotis rufescens]|uniref:uncharacterized protein LOC124128293 n=1 Tax=Haliotis rufescens TaxID=6454 RepID=UPI00201F55F6|nr:uncharacterized protein LOC124128293 [Haliotis rufescens]